jgi:hypothetical protein
MGGFYVALGLFGLGQVRLTGGEPEHARALCRQGLLALRETSPDSVFVVEGLAHMASVDACVGLHNRAQRLMGAYEVWYLARGGVQRTWHPTWSVLIRSLVPLPPTPADPALVRARAHGREMSLDEAAAYALGPPGVAAVRREIAKTATHTIQA